MTAPKNVFLKAINFIKNTKSENVQPGVQKTLKERARDNLRNLGVNRDGDAVFGDKINSVQKLIQPSFNIDFEKNAKFDEDEQSEYIADDKNWILVHVTDYMPENNAIKTTAMAENWSVPRSTVHFALNHVVQSHMGGNWDNRPVVILSPFKDTVQANGNPAGFSVFDTYFSADVDTGFKLPDSARVVQPGNVPDGLLFQIKKNKTIYKADNYTPDEINEILSVMTPQDRKIYDDMLNGVLDEQQQYNLFIMDYSGKIKKAYDMAKNKNAFLSGIMAEAREQMLTNFVKQLAVHMTIERMGYKEITEIYDGGRVPERAADRASEIGIKDVTASNKGHSNSIYAKMEDIYSRLQMLKEELSKSQDFEQLQNVFDKFNFVDTKKLLHIIADSVTKKRPVSANSLYQIFEHFFENYYDSYYREHYGKYAGIQKFDKNLDITVKRYCDFYAKELNDTILQLTKIPGVNKIAEKLNLNNLDIFNSEKER